MNNNENKKSKAVKSIKNSDKGLVAQKVTNTNVRAKVKTKTGINNNDVEEKVDKTRVKKTFEKVKDSSKKVIDPDSSNLKRNIIVFVIVMLIGFTIYYAVGALSGKNSDNDYVNLVSDATVSINSYDRDTLINNGSGVIYKKDNNYGYIVTSYYTVRDGNSFEVNLSGKDIKATMLGGDKYLNIAILAINKNYVKKIAKLGNSNRVNVGELLFVSGKPINNNKQLLITKGRLLDKNFIDTKIAKENYSFNVLKSSNLVGKGESGAPICDKKGLVVGLVIYKESDQKITYSIPINDVKEYFYMFEKGNHIDRPYLGVSVFDASDSDMLEKYELSADTNYLNEGIVVVKINRYSDSYNILKRGDVITKVGNVKANNVAKLRYLLFKYDVGDTIKLTINRNAKDIVVNIKLGKVGDV